MQVWVGQEEKMEPEESRYHRPHSPTSTVSLAIDRTELSLPSKVKFNSDG